jgi:hypothetical protein
MDYNKMELFIRTKLGLGLFTGASIELSGLILKNTAPYLGLQMGRGIRRLGLFLIGAGCRITFFSGVLIGFVDFWEGIITFHEKGQTGLAFVYFASSLFNIFSAGCFIILGVRSYSIYASTLGITSGFLLFSGLILAILSVIAAIIVAQLSDNKLQIWLKCCCWGINGDRHKYLSVDMEQYKLALSE